MKNYSKSVLLIILVTILFSGCGVKVGRYHASSDNVIALKKINTKINVDKFTAYKLDYKVMCRLANDVTTPNKEPFVTYIENAFIEELKMADKYSPTSKITISGHLNNLNVSSGMTDAHWTFDITVSSNNGNRFTVKHTREYSASFLGGIACKEDMPDAFNPTVKELINKIINHPKFNSLLQN
jgi:hypothetical protein